MRPITTLFMALLAGFIMTACTQEQPPAPKSAEPAPAATIPAVEAAKQVAEEVKQKVEETAVAAKTEVEKSVEVVKEQAVTEQAKTVATETADKVKQEAAAAVTAVAKPAAAAAKPPKVVSYEASMGKVTFDHAGHAGKLECSKCHPTEPAVTIVINKEVGHTLCKGCHQSSGGNAPTACAGCHVK